MSNNKKFTYIDLFAGCGGLSEGFMKSGHFHGLAHVEWELPMVNTLRNRLISKWNHTEEEAHKSVIHFDIQKTKELIHGKWDNESIDTYGKTNHESNIYNGLRGIVGDSNVDLIIGGPPCQAYSIAGRAQDKNSMRDDYRNYLFEGFVDVVKEFKPKLFVFENVPGMLSAKPGDIMVTERVHKAFSDIGYEINLPERLKDHVYSADDFEVPQKRRRLIIIGVNNKEGLELDEIYKAIDNHKSDKKLVVKDVLKGLPKFSPLGESIRENGRNISHKLVGENDENITSHEARFHNDRDVGIFKDWIVSKMNEKSLQEKIDYYNNRMNKKSKHAKYRNLEWDKPSPTVVAHLYKDGLMFIHPDESQARSITVREAAILQSFPNDFEFIGSNAACYKMIGNAVPPKMAESIANGIVEYFKKQK